MKKLLHLAIIVIVQTGCTATAYHQSYQKVYYTDYTRYMNDGFLVSALSNFTGYSYISLGNIAVEYKETSVQTVSSTFSFDDMTTQNMLDRLVASAKMYNANGIINVKIAYHPSTYRQSHWLATAEAVFFETMPPIPAFAQLITPPSTPSKKEFALQTIDYLLSNDMGFLQWSSSGENMYFDLIDNQYIFQKEFDEKYGKDTRLAIEIMHRSTKKAQSKAAKNNNL